MEDDSDEEDEKPKRDTKKKVNDEKPVKKGKRKSTATSDNDTEEDDDDDDGEVMGLEEEPCVRIVHSLNNARENHMCGDGLDNMAVGVLKFPLHFASAAVALLNSTEF